jgi:signal transduction histidine kinase
VNSGIQDDTFYKNLWTTILSGNVWSGEIINRRKNGSLYPEELTITPVFDHLGAISGFIAIKIDITKRKAMERSMLESIEREKELNEMKSKFISMASHEFRTPLATIMATCESLLSYSDRMSNEQQEQRLKKIIAKVDQLNKIIEELLQLSKLQSKETQLQPEMFDLEALIRETILELQNSPADSAPIHFDSVHEIINVYLDRKQIKVVISNLLSNAIKYTDATKQITIKLAKTNNIVSLTIADQGIGIPEADMKHLFEPFFRASNAVNLPGTGLGLNIVKEAVNRHHGQIIVKSKLNEGTDFQLILPNAI